MATNPVPFSSTPLHCSTPVDALKNRIISEIQMTFRAQRILCWQSLNKQHFLPSWMRERGKINSLILEA
jgi:hypothetical protein